MTVAATGEPGAQGTTDTPETFPFVIGGKEVKLPKTVDGINLQEAIGQIIGRSRAEAKKDFEKSSGELRELLQKKDLTLEELNAKLQQLEDEKLSVEERTKKENARELDKLRKEIEKAQSESQAHLGKYKNTRIENELLAAISRHPVANPHQLAVLIKAMGGTDLVTENGVDKVVVKMQINGEEQVLSPADAIDKFLAMPENMHHLKNNLRSGGGSSAGGTKRPDGTIAYTRDQLRDPAVRKEALEKVRRGEKVDMPLDEE